MVQRSVKVVNFHVVWTICGLMALNRKLKKLVKTCVLGEYRLFMSGVSDGILTHDLRIRNPMLYTAELRRPEVIVKTII